MAKIGDINELLAAVDGGEKGADNDMELLQNYLSEYLKAYFVVGYDNAGQSVVIMNGKSEQDFDSIECMINRFQGIRFSTNGQEAGIPGTPQSPQAPQADED